MEALKQILRTALTGKDNASYDLFRLMAVAAMVVFFGLSVASFWTGKPWDGLAFATGFSALALAVAGALKVKETTEPDATAPKEEK